MTTKLTGKNGAILYRKSGGSAQDLTGTARGWELDEAAEEIDVSTFEDAALNQEDVLPGIPKRKLDAEGLDSTPQSSRLWRTIVIGDVGQVATYPEGTGSGKYYELMTVKALNANQKVTYNQAITWKVSWKVTSAPASGQVS